MSVKAEHILERWAAELKDKDRSSKAVLGNFDELFQLLHESKVDFDTAHDLVDKAVKAHLPASGLARKIYKDLKKGHATDKTEKEFIDEWHQRIKDTGYQSFYSFYDTTKVVVEKQYGTMSAQEYRTQRRYADAFPEITHEQLVERMNKIQTDLSEHAGENVLEVGDDNEIK